MNPRHCLTLLVLAAGLSTVRAAADPSEQAIPDEVVRRVDPSVVAIQHERAGGSGFIISADGYILTNGHVVMGDDDEDPTQPAKAITVILNDERKYPARVLGFSMDPDVALIKIEAERPLQPVEFADSRAVQIGQRCFAVGTPVGLKRTFTGGLLSNVDRTDLGTETKVFQTDAAINPGNSGGPLFDRSGRVLGLNTYASRGNNNIGFTVPIHVALAVKEHLQTRGRFVRSVVPFFDLSELYDELAASLGQTNGLLITYVMQNAPAEAAGLRAGDILIATDGRPCSARTRAEQLEYEWEQTILPAGTPVDYTVLRGPPGQRKQVTVRAMREALEPLPRFGRHSGELPEHLYGSLGLGVRPLVRLHRIIHNLPDARGVLVTTADRGSAAQRAGLRELDIVTHVAGQPTPTVQAFATALERELAASTKAIEFTLVRGRANIVTALAPFYSLRNREVVLVAPSHDAEYVDLLRRELVADGAHVDLASPDGRISGNGHAGTGKHLPLPAIRGTNYALVLFAGGAGARDLWANPDALRVVSEAAAAGRHLAAVGPATAVLPLGAPDLVTKKMTTSKEDSAKLLGLKANYTGNEVESDGKVITTTGFDRSTVRRFLSAIEQSLLNNS